MSWQRGFDEIQRLLLDRKLELISGAAANGIQHIAAARRILSSAEREIDLNPEVSFVLAYDAARRVCVGLLAQQGLRTTSMGHHVTVEIAVRSQFGGPFTHLSFMRRRRAELQYPGVVEDEVHESETRRAIAHAEAMADAANVLMSELPLFRS